MKRIFFASALILILSAACSKPEPDPEPEPTPITQPSITLDPGTSTKPTLTAAGGSVDIKFTSTMDWTASVINTKADGWISLDKTSGAAGTATIKATVAANTSPDERNATIQIKSGTKTASVVVTQKQKDALTTSASKNEIEAAGGTFTIEVKANISFTWEIAEACKDWISPVETKALTTSTLTFNVAENTATEKREGSVKVKSSLGEEVIKVYQAAAKETPAIVLTRNDYTVRADGETIQVEISSNVDVEVAISDACKDWISSCETKAMSTNTYFFDIAANEGYDSRTGEILFTNTENGLSEKVTVTQVQKDALVVAGDFYEVSCDGGVLEIEVGHNVDFNVSIDKDWVSQVTTKAYTTETLTFEVSANDTDDVRTATISFTSADGSKVQNVLVYQSYVGVIEVTKSSYQVSRLGGIIDVEIGHNVDYIMSIEDDWIHYWGTVSTKAYSTDVMQFLVDQIYDGELERREGTIKFTSPDGSKVQKITVVQEDVKCGLQRLEKYTTLSRDKITAVNFITGSDKTTSMMTNEGGYPIYGETVGTTVNIYTKADKFVVDLNPFRLSFPYASPLDVRGYFEDCSSLKALDLRSWDTSISDNMGRTFLDCSSLESLDISSFNTEKVMDMQYMFSNCHSLSSIDLSSFKTPNLIRADNMFAITYVAKTSELERLDLSNFDTSRLESAYGMVQMQLGLKELDLTGWKSDIGNVDFMLLGTGVSSAGGMDVRCSQDLAETLIRKASSEPSINWIVPGGFRLYESADYSMDGEVSLLNKATKGAGANIYILGDGFADKDIADGSYEAIARQAMEAIFTEEPFKSCRDMFNVYMIKKVSKNNLFVEGAETAFSSVPSASEGGGLHFEFTKVKSEVKKVVGESEIEKATAILFVNHYSNAGAAFMDSDLTRCDIATDYACGFGVAGACLNYFESTLLHEFGHAFAKLDEEYFGSGTTISEIQVNEIRASQNDYGWQTNIDFTNDLSKIRWADYISDPRYADEGLGAYQGGGNYESGVWRPTDYSIMRYNDGGYNAPSRETIYRRINKLAYGAAWEFDRETFKQWDVQRSQR